jgi:exodeoxyribonuclease VII large subunit
MAKPTKSQWDFGELFPKEELRRVLTVSELTTQVKRLLEKSVGQVWVGGEVTNLRVQSSGHAYFSLKDAGAQLSCVLFRGTAAAARDLLADGQKVLLQGDLTVYEARGQYQLIVRAVELQGIGALQAAFEKLKQKLAAGGLFAPERKRPLPAYPQRIGLVTSPTGAAIRDVLHVVQRRNPGLEIVLVPCRVQGDGAAAEIAAAIRLLNEWSASSPAGQPQLNLILITRGGGSLEDLWAFNEEIVARAIFESTLPVVSAIGHEIDFTISDFVADFRAATPSAAAEIITEGVFASREFVAGAPERLRARLRRRLAAAVDELAQWHGRLARRHPRRRLDDALLRLDDLQAGLLRCVKSATRDRTTALQHLTGRFLRVRPALALKLRRERLRQVVRQLNLLGPDQVLARGYSITLDAATGRILHQAHEVRPGQILRTKLSRGEVLSRVEMPPPAAGDADG